MSSSSRSIAPIGSTPLGSTPLGRPTPEGFHLLQGGSGEMYLACHHEIAPSYAVRVVINGESTIAPRVPADAVPAITDVPPGGAVWHLGPLPTDPSWQVVVHRPFGPIIAF